VSAEHPYRAALKRELEAMSEAVADQLDEGHELPFGPEVIEAACRQVTYRRAARQAASEGHRLTAWMIRRLIR
jgi:hypothetical protein